MAAEILQSYLTKLGFSVDAISMKKFEDALTTGEKKVLRVGTAIAGVAAGVEAASIEFAYSMRKMYYQSELANSSVKNLKGLIEPDVKLATGYGISVSRSKAGALTIKEQK